MISKFHFILLFSSFLCRICAKFFHWNGANFRKALMPCHWICCSCVSVSSSCVNVPFIIVNLVNGRHKSCRNQFQWNWWIDFGSIQIRYISTSHTVYSEAHYYNVHCSVLYNNPDTFRWFAAILGTSLAVLSFSYFHGSICHRSFATRHHKPKWMNER